MAPFGGPVVPEV